MPPTPPTTILAAVIYILNTLATSAHALRLNPFESPSPANTSKIAPAHSGSSWQEPKIGTLTIYLVLFDIASGAALLALYVRNCLRDGP